ncbi:hypothetical protein OSM86_24095, partial [Escherichia coli]|nr:hypothetical protein [Escherichia coli]
PFPYAGPLSPQSCFPGGQSLTPDGCSAAEAFLHPSALHGVSHARLWPQRPPYPGEAQRPLQALKESRQTMEADGTALPEADLP